MSSEAELLPCPFCGSATHPEVKAWDDTDGVDGFMVLCSALGFAGQRARGCGAASPWSATPAEAITAWNRRSASPSCVIRPDDRAGVIVGATVEEAKAAAQADYESRIRSALVSHEEPAGDTQGAAKLVAWRAITVAGNVLYFAANDKPVEPSWEIIPLYAAPAALVSPPDNGGPTEAEIDDAVRCIGLGVSAGIADTVNVGAALRRFVAGRAALQSHNEGSE